MTNKYTNINQQKINNNTQIARKEAPAAAKLNEDKLIVICVYTYFVVLCVLLCFYVVLLCFDGVLWCFIVFYCVLLVNLVNLVNKLPQQIVTGGRSVMAHGRIDHPGVGGQSCLYHSYMISYHCPSLSII